MTDDVIDKRSDTRLGLAVSAVWVCAALVTLGAVGGLLVNLKGGALLTFGGADGDLAATELGQLDQADPREGLDPVLADIPVHVRLVSALPPLVGAVAWIAVAALVTRVLNETGRGRPFSAVALRALPRAALALGAGALLQLTADVVATVVVFADPTVQHLFAGLSNRGFDFPGTTFVCAVLIGALAVAFRRGAALEHELAGLV